MRKELETLKGRVAFFKKDDIPVKLQFHHLRYTAIHIIKIQKTSSSSYDWEESLLIGLEYNYFEFSNIIIEYQKRYPTISFEELLRLKKKAEFISVDDSDCQIFNQLIAKYLKGNSP